MSFRSTISSHKKIVSAALGALILLAVCLVYTLTRPPVVSPDITTPALAVAALDAQSPYFTISARDYLSKKKPEWVSAHNSEEDRRDFKRAEADPEMWRQLDHKYHFDAILLCGDPGEYRKLLDHLLLTRDWTLTYLDHTSLIFKRSPAKPWSIDDFHALQQKFANHPKPDRALFLMQSGAKLVAVGEFGLSKQLLDESLSLDGNSAEAWTQLANYEMQDINYGKALEYIGRALAIDGENEHALATKAQIYYSMKRYDDALAVSEQLVKAEPDDQNILFFHSKIAHEAHAYSQEIATLKHLIELAEKEHEPTAGFHIYLAQAYARKEDNAGSLEEFQKALDEGGLSPEQLQYINDSMTTLKSNSARVKAPDSQ